MTQKQPSDKNALRRHKSTQRTSIRPLTSILILSALVTAVFFSRFEIIQSVPLALANILQDSEALDLKQSGTPRGIIYDRHYNKLAMNVQTTAVYARPFELEDPTEAGRRLAPILDITEDELLITLQSERGFVWLRRGVPLSQSEQIKELNLKGIYIIEEMNRFYPLRQTAAHAVGFARENHGLAGLEFFYDAILQGGTLLNDKDLKKFSLPPESQISSLGGNLILTLDLPIQALLEKKLNNLLVQTKAKSGTALLMDTENGAVLAMVNLPSYDPNYFWKYGDDERRNQIAESPVYPDDAGSLHLQSKTPEAELSSFPSSGADATTLFPEKRKRAITLHSRSLLSESEVDITPLGLLGHPSPDIAGSSKDFSAPFTTPLQLLSSIACIVNGGKKITPHLLAAVQDRESKQRINSVYNSAEADMAPPENTQELLQLFEKSGQAGSGDSLILEASNTLTDAAFGLIVGLAPKENPKLALLITLDQATVSPATWQVPTIASGQTPLTALTNGLFPELINLAKAKLPESQPTDELREIDRIAFQVSRDHGGESSTGKATDTQVSTMPSIIGKSLRSGLQVMQDYKMLVKIDGSGTIESQNPKPGSNIKSGDICILKLSNPSNDEQQLSAQEKRLARL